jgi:hypothetical protein
MDSMNGGERQDSGYNKGFTVVFSLHSFVG